MVVGLWLVLVMPPGMTRDIGVATIVFVLALAPFPVIILLEESITELPLMDIVDELLDDPPTEPPTMLVLDPPETLIPEAVLVLVETLAREVDVIRIPRLTILSPICPAASVARTLRM